MINKKLGLFISTCLSLVVATTSVAAAPVADSVQVGLSKDLIYFVFPDRYLNGDTSNDKFPAMTQVILLSFMAGISRV